MKRSQMVAMIRQKLIGTAINGPPVNALSPEFPEQILMLMEELGMRPPQWNINQLCYSDDWQNEDGTHNGFYVRDENDAGN